MIIDGHAHACGEFAADNQMPLFIHLWSKEEAVKLMNVAKNHPETNFILLHLIGLEAVAEYAHHLRNIYYEISAYSYISEKRVKYAVDTFGADHVIFGSDTPWDHGGLGNNLERIHKMDCTDIEKEQILGTNMASILKL